MILENYYYYFTSAIPEIVCDDIIKTAQQHQERLGVTGTLSEDDIKNNPEAARQNLSHRDSYITWIDDEWIYNEIHPWIQQANINAGWNFDWERSEACQFTKYKLNQYYHWHEDQDAKPNEHGTIRKLSCSVQLCHPHEYEGGDLQFHTPHGEFTVNEIKPKGSICIFPSFVKHRVKPVTSGIRQSLVIWSLGKPYR